ncbi:hypothetical protein Taro_013561, partial [Colocasia esculenta]|nr:hypothetical protein [Colocasia esculenta]
MPVADNAPLSPTGGITNCAVGARTHRSCKGCDLVQACSSFFFFLPGIWRSPSAWVANRDPGRRRPSRCCFLSCVCCYCGEMSSGEILGIEPSELRFPLELKKQISCSLQLVNKTEDYVAFKVKTTNPKKYCVRPNTGVVLPHSTCDIIVTMQAQREAPADMQCKDKFLVQSVIASPGTTVKDITAEMFTAESGNTVDECKLRVVYVSPPQPPSPVREGSEEGSSPRTSISENGAFSYSELASRAFSGYQEKPPEATALISKLTEEKNSVAQQNNKLRQELINLDSMTLGCNADILIIELPRANDTFQAHLPGPDRTLYYLALVLGYNQLVDHVRIHGQRRLTETLNKDSLVRQKEYPTESLSKSRES